MSVKRVRFLQFICAVFALSSTGTLVLTSMASADAVADSGTVAQAMQSAASWPLHVVLGAVALGSVWMCLSFSRQKDLMSFERDKLNAQAIGRVADALIALRDEQHNGMARMSAERSTIRKRPPHTEKPHEPQTG